jgi:hypothetical protein
VRTSPPDLGAQPPLGFGADLPRGVHREDEVGIGDLLGDDGEVDRRGGAAGVAGVGGGGGIRGGRGAVGGAGLAAGERNGGGESEGDGTR